MPIKLASLSDAKDICQEGFIRFYEKYDSVDNPKPAADPVVLFCENCKVHSQEVLVVGDNVHDLQMARTGNVALKVGVLSGNSEYQDLKPYADFVLDSVLELPDLLRTQNLI